MATPALYDFPEIRRGDTVRALALRLYNTDTGDPYDIVWARCQLRDKNGDVIVYEWCTDLGNISHSGVTVNDVVTLHAIDDETCEAFPPRNLEYDLEVRTSDGVKWTVLYGNCPVVKDSTR